MRRLLVSALVTAALLLPGSSPPEAGSVALRHHREGGFRNLNPAYRYPVWGRLLRMVGGRFERSPARGAAPAVLANNGVALRENGTRPTVTWVGHSTFLLQLEGVNLLTDPHWGERVSPVDFAGPRRLVRPGIAFEALPPIHAVLISHDHYDHLDAETVDRLWRDHRPRFFVPLGVRAWLRERGIYDVVELDWWETARFGELTVACTPAQHSSGRGIADQNRRLWSSWVVVGRDRRLFFAGDTGYDEGLREIGERFGPFDLAAIPIGGYGSYRDRHPNHVNPEEALQLFEDVRGRLMVPMHWATFELNREPFREPADRLLREALARGLEEKVALLSPGQTVHW